MVQRVKGLKEGSRERSDSAIVVAEGNGDRAGTVKVKGRAGKQETYGTMVEVPALNIRRVCFEIRQYLDSPLVLHCFAEKSIREMLAKQMHLPVVREAKDPEQQYEESRYKADGGGDGFPTMMMKECMVTAARQVGMFMTTARQQIFVLSQAQETRHIKIALKKQPGEEQRYKEFVTKTALIRILDAEPTMRMDVVRLAGQKKPPDLRFRPEYNNWRARVEIDYDADSLTEQTVANILYRAGRTVGLGEGRPEKCSMGWGLFEIGS